MYTLADFARPEGARDKKPRKRRAGRILGILGGVGVGAVTGALGGRALVRNKTFQKAITRNITNPFKKLRIRKRIDSEMVPLRQAEKQVMGNIEYVEKEILGSIEENVVGKMRSMYGRGSKVDELRDDFYKTMDNYQSRKKQTLDDFKSLKRKTYKEKVSRPSNKEAKRLRFGVNTGVQVGMSVLGGSTIGGLVTLGTRKKRTYDNEGY